MRRNRKDAEPVIAEVEDARKRLAGLRGITQLQGIWEDI
jgi:hypothetical protein